MRLAGLVLCLSALALLPGCRPSASLMRTMGYHEGSPSAEGLPVYASGSGFWTRSFDPSRPESAQGWGRPPKGWANEREYVYGAPLGEGKKVRDQFVAELTKAGWSLKKGKRRLEEESLDAAFLTKRERGVLRGVYLLAVDDPSRNGCSVQIEVLKAKPAATAAVTAPPERPAHRPSG